MLIEDYEFLEIIDSNNLKVIRSTDLQGGFEPSLVESTDIIVLHDRFLGDNYTWHDLLPEWDSYDGYDRGFTNLDYDVFVA